GFTRISPGISSLPTFTMLRHASPEERFMPSCGEAPVWHPASAQRAVNSGCRSLSSDSAVVPGEVPGVLALVLIVRPLPQPPTRRVKKSGSAAAAAARRRTELDRIGNIARCLLPSSPAGAILATYLYYYQKV